MLVLSQHASANNWHQWSQLLQTHVSPTGEVDYSGIENTQQVDAIAKQIGNQNIDKLGQNELLSFYINSYNALAVKGILQDQSPSSLFGRYIFFKRQKYTVANEEINLYDLEHKKIRPLNDPRIHFAIVCASQSCPKLLNTAYTVQTLDQQLDAAAIEFINNPDKNHFDQENKVAYLSKIFEWFSEDFSSEDTTLLDYIAQYINQPQLAQDLREGSYKIKYKSYNWNLNGHYN